MSSEVTRQKELEDVELKLAGARQAAAAPDASERDKADLKLMEQECIAARREAYRPRGSGNDAKQATDAKQELDNKLDEALNQSFPGSDPVSFTEPTAVKEADRSLPEVKLADQQAPQKAAAAKKAR